MAWRISTALWSLWLSSSTRVSCPLLPRKLSLLRVLLTMTATVTKSKPKVTLRTVKVTAIGSRKKSPNNGNKHNTASENSVPQDKINIEEMVNKGLDLAESGIGLGVNIVARLGTIFKDQVIDKLNDADILSSVMNNSTNSQANTENQRYANGQAHPEQTQTEEDAQSADAGQSYYLFNRLPLFPGSEAALSFSINNDSLTSEKEIQLQLENFVGEKQQLAMDASTFTVTPSKIAIAPVDFEKFVIKGKIPLEAPEDIYHGWVIVSEEQTYRIPVVLVVSKTQKTPTEQTPLEL